MKFETLVKRFEDAYKEEKAKEAEALHSAINNVLAEQRPSLETILYVLEIVRFELLQYEYKKLFESK